MEKLYIETHEKYIEQLKPKKVNKNNNKTPRLYGKIKLPKISGYNINIDLNENNKSKELKNHGREEIAHQKPGHEENQEQNEIVDN